MVGWLGCSSFSASEMGVVGLERLFFCGVGDAGGEARVGGFSFCAPGGWRGSS